MIFLTHLFILLKLYKFACYRGYPGTVKQQCSDFLLYGIEIMSKISNSNLPEGFSVDSYKRVHKDQRESTEKPYITTAP